MVSSTGGSSQLLLNCTTHVLSSIDVLYKLIIEEGKTNQPNQPRAVEDPIYSNSASFFQFFGVPIINGRQ